MPREAAAATTRSARRQLPLEVYITTLTLLRLGSLPAALSSLYFWNQGTELASRPQGEKKKEIVQLKIIALALVCTVVNTDTEVKKDTRKQRAK